MRLLVSVATAAEVAPALDGGADIIDAKDPLLGPLGAVSIDELRRIHAACSELRPVSAALGDATSERAIEDDAYAYCLAGAAFVKIGFAGITCVKRVESLLAAAVRGVRAAISSPTPEARSLVSRAARNPTPSALDHSLGGVIAVAYLDVDAATTIAFTDLVPLAARAGVAGILLDTADKLGPGLGALITPDALATWVSKAHREELVVALAGRLTADDLPLARHAGADIAGVRGAVCEGGRAGRVVANKVRVLRALCESEGRGRHGPPEGGHYVRLRT